MLAITGTKKRTRTTTARTTEQDGRRRPHSERTPRRVRRPAGRSRVLATDPTSEFGARSAGPRQPGVQSVPSRVGGGAVLADLRADAGVRQLELTQQRGQGGAVLAQLGDERVDDLLSLRSHDQQLVSGEGGL
jgi:hypothetical protein